MVLKKNIAEATAEQVELIKQKNRELDETRKKQIQIQIDELENFIQENKDQLETM